MEQSQPTFTIPSQLGKQRIPLPWNANPREKSRQRKQNVVLGMDIFSNLAEKKSKHGSQALI